MSRTPEPDDDGFGANVMVEDDGGSSRAVTPAETPSGNDSHGHPRRNSYPGTGGNHNNTASGSNNNNNDQIIRIQRSESNASRQSNAMLRSSGAPSNQATPGPHSLSNIHLLNTVTTSTTNGYDPGLGMSTNSTAASPSFGGQQFVSFQSPGGAALSALGVSGLGRKCVSGSISNVSGIFVPGSHGGHDQDDDDNDGNGGGAGGRTTGGGSSGDGKDSPTSGSGHNKKKMLPQPVANDEELKEELDAEIMHCAETQAKTCNLSKLQIQRIPQEIRCFSWLKELYLGDNKIALLPDTIFIQMQQLEVLDLMENKLTTVPRSVFQLKSLRKILLDHNRIYCLPDEIDPDPIERFGLPELVEVGLEWNNLQQFPTNLLIYAPKIERMFLSENPGISHLPPVALLEKRREFNSRQAEPKKIQIRLDNRPMLLQAAASNPIYQQNGGVVSLEWNKIYPDRVLDFLYLGSMRTAQCVEVYNDLDIGYVLTAARNLEVVLGLGMKHLTLPFDDLPGEDISHFFESSFRFIDEACASKRGILIHCFAGLSRSVAMTMGYLMKKFRLGADDALDLIRQSRPSAHPNEGFVNRLRDYEKELCISPEESKRMRAELEKKNTAA